jgi:hypothetical protein
MTYPANDAQNGDGTALRERRLGMVAKYVATKYVATK